MRTLPAGKSPRLFGYHLLKEEPELTYISLQAPRIHLALQFLLRNHFRIADVFAVRIARAVHRFSKFPQADSSVTITYTNDEHPDFQRHESKSAEVDIFAISGSYKARVIQCLQKQGVMPMLLDDYNVSNELTGTPSAQQQTTRQSGTLDTIPEGDESSQSAVSYTHLTLPTKA